MTHQEFISKYLSSSIISKHKTEDGWLHIDRFPIHGNEHITEIPSKIEFSRQCTDVFLEGLFEIPSEVIFNNQGDLSLPKVMKMSSDVKFTNSGNIKFNYLKVIPEDVVFENYGNVSFPSLKYVSYNVFFNNGANVRLGVNTIFSKGVRFNEFGEVFNSNIPIPSHISMKMYLNIMIKQVYR